MSGPDGGLHAGRIQRVGGDLLKKRSTLWLVLCCLGTLARAPEASSLDGITLTVDYGVAPGDVMLQWTGGQPAFTIYRAATPQAVVSPANQIGQSTPRAWADTPPAGTAFFYEVTSPCVYAPPEVCDGVDNDCDGSVDNGLTSPPNNCVQAGVCAGSVPVCLGASGWKCNYFSRPNVELDASGNLPAQESRCDHLDGNCNGTVDLDGFPNLGQACFVGLGVCQGSGTIACTASQTSAACNAVANWNLAVSEKCDGIDNNCNGLVDERTDFTTPLGTPTQGWRDAVVAVPKPGGGTVYVYAYEASRPGATASTTGLKDDRACSTPAVLPWNNLTQAQASAACAAVRDSLGQPMRLCTSAEWTAACEGPGGAAAAKWSFSVTPTVYSAQVCNDVTEPNFACAWPTGTVSSQALALNKFCDTDWGAPGRIYDLSGNLAEWTSTTVAGGALAYGLVRGGAFHAASAGATCETDDSGFQPGSALPSLGFRCCADNAP